MSTTTGTSASAQALFLCCSSGCRRTKTVKNRLHLDLRVTDFDDAVERARALGATSATDVYDGDGWQVFRDPEGNEFCIIRPAG